MKKFDVEIKRSVSGSDPLPVGGYVAKIMNAEVQSGTSEKGYYWEQLVVSFDIAEGDYKDFFANQYKANTNEDKKWKGNFRINVPQEGNQWYDSQKRTFGNAIACIEESNNGYHWDWDEAKLKGKLVGVLYRNFEWEVNGNTGWSTECGTFVGVDDIRNGNFRQMKDRPLKNKPVETKPVFEEVVSDEDLPF